MCFSGIVMLALMLLLSGRGSPFVMHVDVLVVVETRVLTWAACVGIADGSGDASPNLGSLRQHCDRLQWRERARKVRTQSSSDS